MARDLAHAEKAGIGGRHGLNLTEHRQATNALEQKRLGWVNMLTAFIQDLTIGGIAGDSPTYKSETFCH